MQIMQENTSLRKCVLDMQVGETLTVSIDAYSYTTIRSYASDLGFMTGRTYSAKRDRVSRAYTITREA